MDALRTLLENVSAQLDSDPALKGGLAIGGTVAGLAALAYSWLRPRKTERVKVTVDAPRGEAVHVQIGSKQEKA